MTCEIFCDPNTCTSSVSLVAVLGELVVDLAGEAGLLVLTVGLAGVSPGAPLGSEPAQRNFPLGLEPLG